MLCIYFHWKISNAIDDGTELPLSVQSHIEKCSECRQYHQQTDELDARLSLTAKDSIRFDLKVQNDTVSSSAIGHNYVKYALSAAALVLIGIFLWSAWQGSSGKSKIANTASSVNPVEEYRRLWLDLPAGVSQLNTEPSSLMTGYYYKELLSLVNETQSAVQFITDCTGLNMEQFSFPAKESDSQNNL